MWHTDTSFDTTVQDPRVHWKKEDSIKTKAVEKQQGVGTSRKRIVRSEPLHDNNTIALSKNKTKKREKLLNFKVNR